MADKQCTAASRYKRLETKRQSYLDRARIAASYTIPHLFPPQGSNETTTLRQPYNNVGAEGINNLAAKLLLSQMSPNSPFFKLEVDTFTAEKLANGDPNFKIELDRTFAMIEEAVQKNIEMSGDRVAANEAFKQVLIAGNVLLYLPPKGTMRVIRLDQYVLKRDCDGKVEELILKECVCFDDLPEDVQACVTEKPDDNEKLVDLYTHLKLEDGTNPKWTSYQEVCGTTIESTRGTYLQDESPYIPLRYCSVDGEDYGRSFVEEYIGDLQTLDGLSQAIKEGSIAAARVIPLINPNGNLRPKDLEKPNGTPVLGEAADVTFVQVNKQADMSTAVNYAAEVERRLQRAFILFSGVQRQAERVTAEEIKAIINELDERLGGFYSILGQEFQLPYVKCKMARMKRDKVLPALPKGIVRPAIITGLQALGRGQDLDKLKQYLQIMQGLLGQEFTLYTNVDAISSKVSAALSYDASGVMKSQDEVEQEKQTMAANAAASKMAGPGVNQLGQLMQGAMNNGQQGQG